MFAEIIPLARLPKNLSFFDYEIPEESEGKVKIGQIVKIFFRGKKISGVITAVKEKPAELKIPVKPFIKIIDSGINLDEKRLEFLRWFSDYYLVSPALVLKTFIAEPVLRTGVKKAEINDPSLALSVAKNDSEEIGRQIKSVSSSGKSRFLLHYANPKNKIAVFMKCSERLVAAGKDVLILLPQVPDIAVLRPYFADLFSGKIAELHGNLSKTEYWREWEKIKSGNAKIVIGTRSALFAPLRNIGLIIVDDEDASDFKQSDQNPRYDARDAALKLSEITGSGIIFSSQSPRPETYFSFRNTADSEYFPPKSVRETAVTLVDMNEEMKNKNFSSVSGVMAEKIGEALGKKKKIVLLLNRRGLSTMVLCRDCNHVFRCGNCQLPLACHDDECSLPGKFVCHNCGTSEPVQPVCPKCRGVNIKYLGTGTQTVEKEIKKKFPGGNILRIDKDVQERNLGYKIAENDIFIGTQFLLRNYLSEIKNIGLFGVISADTIFYRPDFRSGEKIFSWLTSIINFAHRARSGVIIQTFLPNNFIVRSAAAENPESFYLEELDNRQTLNYPPFGRLIKLAYGSPDEKKCAAEAAGLLALLEREMKDEAEVSGGSKPRREKRKFFSKIIIKFSDKSSGVIKKILKENVPDTWTIDIDPESVL